MDAARREELMARYAGGVDAVLAALEGAGDAELDARPADGGWTAREVAHHLADSETRSMLRLRQLVAGAEELIETYDQDAWADALPYHLPIDSALEVLRAVRAMSLATLRALGDGDWAKQATHPEHEAPYTVELWLELYAEHPYEHAEQIAQARASTRSRSARM